MSHNPEEKILVVRRATFDAVGSFQGFANGPERYLSAFLEPGANFFLPRSSAEEDPTHKQIIPYMIGRIRDRFLIYTRGKSGGEARLHAKRSIGVGGHINEIDCGAATLNRGDFETALCREALEEMTVSIGANALRPVGLINDDSNDVGRVHLGVVYFVDLEGHDVVPGEAAIVEPEFLTLDEIQQQFDRLETWSQIALKAIVDMQADD